MKTTVERFVFISIVVLLITFAYTCEAEEVACTKESDLLSVKQVQEYLRCTFKNINQPEITACEQEVLRKSRIPLECAKLYERV